MWKRHGRNEVVLEIGLGRRLNALSFVDGALDTLASTMI
jgi:hypothetical protein